MKIDEDINYEDFSEIIDESKTDLSSYIDKRLKLAKLKIYEKIASTFSYILYSLIIVLFLVILVTVFLIGLGLFIGRILNDYSAGFGILILITLAILFIAYICRRGIRRYLMNITVRAIKIIEKDEA